MATAIDISAGLAGRVALVTGVTLDQRRPNHHLTTHRLPLTAQ